MFQETIRHGEQGKIPFRNGRFYCIEDEWWFSIRRGPDQGPYTSQSEARHSLIEFLNDQFEFEKYLRQSIAQQA